MTLQSIKDFVEGITEDTFSNSYFISKMNEIRDEIDGERNFEFSTSSTNYTPSSSGQALPTDFAQEIKVVQGSSLTMFTKVKIEDLPLYAYSAFIYAIDYANSLIYFGSSATGTATLYYNKRNTDFAALTETPNYPTRFHRIFAYKFITDYFLGEDIDDVNQGKGVLYNKKYENMLALLKNQDAWRKCNATGRTPSTTEENLIADGIIPQ